MTDAPFTPPDRLLMGPGPSPIHPDTLAALARPTVGHLDPAPVTAEVLAGIADHVARGTALVASPDARSFAQLNMDYHGFGLSLTDNLPLRATAERLYFLTARIWLQSIPRMDLASECAIFLSEMQDTAARILEADRAAQ